MSSVPFFTTRKRSEAERLLPIVARGNGGLRSFSVKEVAGVGYNFILYFNGPAAKSVELGAFLKGYLAAEAQKRRTDRYLWRLRAAHRRG
jgi:hypothetical protein